jgi:hypothetical protein
LRITNSTTATMTSHIMIGRPPTEAISCSTVTTGGRAET